MSTRDYDLVVYGATGFTGRQAAATIQRSGGELRWCIAGRNQTKLEALRDELGLGQLPIEVADALDEDAIDKLVARTRVLLTTAGPYAKFGELLIAACARHGTDYVDITGETPWIRDMMDRYHAAAVATGARIVPFCGFDSVPSDIGVWFMVQQLRERGTGTVLVRGVHRSKGGFNGGTLATAMNLAETGMDRRLSDRRLLDPPETRDGPKLRADPRAAEYSAELGRWTVPFFMGPVNSRVVRRSAALSGLWGAPYGEAFDYEERMGFGKSGLGARAFTVGLGLALGLLGAAWGRSLLKPILPKPGEGPSEETMDGGFMKVDLLAEGEDGTTLRGRLSAKGDPGNRVTVALLCACALSLVHQRDALPGGSERLGFLTPATAFGQVLLDRMRAEGMTLELTEP